MLISRRGRLVRKKLVKQDNKQEIKKNEIKKENIKEEKNLSKNSSLISFQDKDNNELNEENFIFNDLNEENIVKKIDEKDTNIFFTFNIPYLRYNNSNNFSVYINKNTQLEPIFIKIINEDIIFFYHYEIKEGENSKNKNDNKQTITLIVDKNYSYYSNINFIYNKLNYFYELNWEKSKNNKDEKEIPKNNYIIYLFYFILKYLEKANVTKNIILDLLNELYEYLNKKKNIKFDNLIFLLVETIKINNKELIFKILDIFENKNIIYQKHIDNYLIQIKDIEEYFFEENDILNEKEDENDDIFEEEIQTNNNKKKIEKYKIIIEKIKINILLRYAQNRFYEYFQIIKSKNELINYIFELIDNENKNNNKNFLLREILYYLFDIVRTKEKLKILLHQCSDISIFTYVINRNINLIAHIIGNNSLIKVIEYINVHSLSLGNDNFNDFIQNFRRILENQRILGYLIFDFDEIIQFYLKKMKVRKDLDKCLILIHILNSNKNIFPSKIISLGDETYHRIFLYFVDKKLITNENLLEIIDKKDKYYYDKSYENENNRPLDIFDNVEIDKESEKFFELFKKK